MATGDNNLGRPREEGGRDRGEKRETRKRATEVEAEECMRMRYEYAAAAGNPRLQRDNLCLHFIASASHWHSNFSKKQASKLQYYYMYVPTSTYVGTRRYVYMYM